MPPNSSIPPEAPTIPLEEWPEGDAGSQTAAAAIDLGSVLAGRYRLIANIGEGGSSRVYEAIDLNREGTDRDQGIVALKVLSRPFDETAGHFAALCAQFTRWRRLSHPYIVRLFECEREGPVVFMTMEYVAGESVYSKLHRAASTGEAAAALDGVEARQIISAVAQALEYAHQQGLVHGDLKPGNVMVTARAEVKVIDFCVTRWLSRPKPAGAAPAGAATPRYASPQVMAGEKPKPCDDVFSLACFAYEILTGFHPFDGAADVRAPAPPRRRGLSSAEHSALMHGLQWDRDDRTATVKDFTAEFAAVSHRRLTASWPLWAGAAALVLFGWLYHRGSAPTVPLARPRLVARQAVSKPLLPAPTGAEPGTLIQDCPTCPSMTVLPPGQFLQGAAPDENGALPLEKPAHRVHIVYPLALSTTDITVDDFRQFAIATGRDMRGCDTYDGSWRQRPAASWGNPGFKQSGRHPAACISWNDAVAYAEWLSGKTGHRYRLPSSSEWEYAARAGGEAMRPWKSDPGAACADANVADRSAERRFPGWSVFPCNDGYVFTAPAGSFKANAFGLRDMMGNVLVWTEDCWRPDYDGAPTDGSAREETNCRERELRGGSWFSAPAAVRASYRDHFASDYRTSSVGFRVVRDMN